jgi:hypothetical protein
MQLLNKKETIFHAKDTFTQFLVFNFEQKNYFKTSFYFGRNDYSKIFISLKNFISYV